VVRIRKTRIAASTRCLTVSYFYHMAAPFCELIPLLVFVSDVNQHKGPYVGQVMKCFDDAGTQVRSIDDDDDAEDYY